jgi:hypothetical protein
LTKPELQRILKGRIHMEEGEKQMRTGEVKNSKGYSRVEFTWKRVKTANRRGQEIIKIIRRVDEHMKDKKVSSIIN